MSTPLSPTVRGALWMLASMTSFAAMNTIVRHLSETIPSFELVFLRSVIGFAVLLPFLLHRGGLPSLQTRRWGMHFVRAALTYLGVASWFYALTYLPMVEAVSLHFTLPLFGVLLAILILKERVTSHRWIAMAVGFAGVMVILRPGMVDISVLAFVVLFSALAYAGGDIALKMLAATESPAMITFTLNLFMIPMALVPALFEWVTPGWADVPAILGLGATGIAAHVCLARAMAAADASVVIPMEFIRLPLMAFAGYVFFAEIPDGWTVTGAIIVFCGAYYVAWKERGQDGGGH